MPDERENMVNRRGKEKDNVQDSDNDHLVVVGLFPGLTDVKRREEKKKDERSGKLTDKDTLVSKTY